MQTERQHLKHERIGVMEDDGHEGMSEAGAMAMEEQMKKRSLRS